MKVFFLTAALGLASISTFASACSEAGKHEFTMSRVSGEACARLGDETALAVAQRQYPPLAKEETPEQRPNPPLRTGGLDPKSSKEAWRPHATLVKKEGNGESRLAIFSSSVSAAKGNWECLYCIEFAVKDNSCAFRKIWIDHCAGGVAYSASKK